MSGGSMYDHRQRNALDGDRAYCALFNRLVGPGAARNLCRARAMTRVVFQLLSRYGPHLRRASHYGEIADWFGQSATSACTIRLA